MTNKCLICSSPTEDKLCPTHLRLYKWDPSILGLRLKKRSAGSRYTQNKYHKNEIRLTKLLEEFYGKKNIITSYHPLWAKSNKKVLYEFDIYIKTKDILIEYTPFFHKTKLSFIKQLKRDKNKIRLVKKNGKKLIIFKYDEPLFKDYVINKIEGELNGIINTSRH
jgi:hypothetical protein